MKKLTAFLLTGIMCFSCVSGISCAFAQDEANETKEYERELFSETFDDEEDGCLTLVYGDSKNVMLPEEVSNERVIVSFDMKIDPGYIGYVYLARTIASESSYQRLLWMEWNQIMVNKGGLGNYFASVRNFEDFKNITVTIDLKNKKIEAVHFDGQKMTNGYLPDINYNKIIGFNFENKSVNNNKSEDKKIYFDNLKVIAKAPIAKNVDVSGTFLEGETLTGSYDILYDEYTEDASVYRWLSSDSEDGEYTLINGQTEKTITIDSSLINKYLKFQVTPVIDGAVGKEVQSRAVCAEAAPEAKRVWATGALLQNAVLTAHLEYFDKNGDKEGEHVFTWYKCDDENGTNPVKIGEGKEYTVTDDESIKYIILGAYAVSQREPYMAENEVFSEVVREALPPEARNVKISGESKIGAALTGTFDFYDPNNDDEGEHIYKWYRANDEKGSGKTEIGNEKTYTVTEDDISKYITFEVKPVSVNEPKEGTQFYQSEAFVAPQRPYAVDVKISGKAQKGETLTGEYTYKHYFGIPEKGTAYRWLMSSNNNPQNGIEIGTEASIVLKKEHVGKYIFFEVTPSCYEAPEKGESYVSAGVRVKSADTGGSVSVGGGSGSGGGTTAKPSTPTNKPNTTPKSDFTDIGNHWAKNDIETAVANGIVKGMTETTFAPDQNVTAAQYLAMVMRAVGISCEDKSGNEWYSDYVKKAKDAGLIGDSFNPTGDITREDMAVLTVKAYEYAAKKTLDEKESNMTDSAQITAEKVSFVNKAVNKGFIKGMGDGTFSPQTMTTRAQSITVILRLTGALKEDK